MEFIESKDIFLLMKDILGLTDRKVIDHGYRVAYMVVNMLHCKGGYEPYELADIALLVTLHDIGACKTDREKDALDYEAGDTRPHSIYSYLFFKYLSPQKERAMALLLHHMDYNQLSPSLSEEVKLLAACLNVAECADIYLQALGDRFQLFMFDRYKDTKLSGECLKFLEDAIQTQDVFRKLQDGTYREDMDRLLEYMIFSNEEMDQYLEMLVYSLGFVNESMVIDTVTRICISQAIGGRMLLNSHQQEVLHYGALLCDIGMLGIDKEIVGAPRRLTFQEMEKLQSHVEIAVHAMENYMSQEIVSLIGAHHERGDGSGYPARKINAEMNDLQRILQVSDVMTALINDRPWRKRKEQEEVLEILREEEKKGRLSPRVVDTLIAFYEDIYRATREEEAKVLATYKKLVASYKKIESSFFGPAEEPAWIK